MLARLWYYRAQFYPLLLLIMTYYQRHSATIKDACPRRISEDIAAAVRLVLGISSNLPYRYSD
jgi:hypothetical protein